MSKIHYAGVVVDPSKVGWGPYAPYSSHANTFCFILHFFVAPRPALVAGSSHDNNTTSARDRVRW